MYGGVAGREGRPSPLCRLLSKQAADRGKTPCSNNLSFLNGLPVEADRHVLLSAFFCSHGLFARNLRVARI